MKLKAVVAVDCPPEVATAIEGMRQEVMARVVGPHLHRPNFGPAEFYIQQCDRAVSEEGLCEVRLSGVSLSRDRSEQDFDDARKALEELYVEKILAYLPIGKSIQLMVSIMLDAPRRDGSTLVEGKPVRINGAYVGAYVV